MGDAYRRLLTGLAEVLAEMCLRVAGLMEDAARALLNADLALSEQVISGDGVIDDLRDTAEEKAVELLARQTPVATDLRAVVAGIHRAGDVERTGDLAVHVARAARRRHPRAVLPAEATAYFLEMGRIATALARKAGEVVRSRNLDNATTMESDDDAMDDLHRHIFRLLVSPGWRHDVGPAVDITLLARFHERYSDHAVSVAHRVVYVVTGRNFSPLTV